MKVRERERRVARRLPIKTALRLRVWKSGPIERRSESLDLSETERQYLSDRRSKSF